MWKVNLSNERIGTTGKNNFGSIMEVVEYKNKDNIAVRFIEHNYELKTRWRDFENGLVRSPYDKTALGVGFLGEGQYKATINGKSTPQYNRWLSMMIRCYSSTLHENYQTYKGCSVDERWHNYQTFAAWYDQNYYEIENSKMDLDKDILIKGNKVYSPETCIFVPHLINLVFTRSKDKKGNLPIGVVWEKKTKKYIAQCGVKGKRASLGYYDTPEEAFLVYKSFKENYIKQLAEEYKNKVPNNLYEVMINYEVDIND